MGSFYFKLFVFSAVDSVGHIPSLMTPSGAGRRMIYKVYSNNGQNAGWKVLRL